MTVLLNAVCLSSEVIMNEKTRRIVRIAAALVLIVCLGICIFYVFDNIKSRHTAEKLNELKGSESEYTVPEILHEYRALCAENEDTIGWLKIEGTTIDNVVMQAPDEINKYLHLDFYGNYSYRGCLFLDEYCDVLCSDNLIIYGHNMKDGSMFGALMDYVNEDFYREHKLICFDSIYEKHTYEVVAAIKTNLNTEDASVFRYDLYVGENDKKMFTEYAKFINDNKLYATDSELQKGDKILTLTTCAYHENEGRFIVVARQIS